MSSDDDKKAVAAQLRQAIEASILSEPRLLSEMEKKQALYALTEGDPEAAAAEVIGLLNQLERPVAKKLTQK